MSEQSSKGVVTVAYEDYIQLLQLAGVSKEDAVKVADAKIEASTLRVEAYEEEDWKERP